jgi:hypothetical protein
MAQLLFDHEKVVAGIDVRCPKPASYPHCGFAGLIGHILVERRIVEASALSNGGRDNLGDLVHGSGSFLAGHQRT